MKQRLQDHPVPNGFAYLEPYLQEFRKHHPHIDRNVFIMLPFSSGRSDSIFGAIQKELEDHGLIALRSDQQTLAPDLWWNVVTYMLGSSYGVVVYEPRGDVVFNPNVSIEAGFMLALDRPVLFLANCRLRGLPVDFSGRIFRTYDGLDGRRLAGSVRSAVADWVEHDLSYFDYGQKKLVLFVSLGGTCRCVIGKAILSDLIDRKKIPGLVVDAAAIADPHHATISPSALKAIRETGRERWIDKHRPRKLSPYLQRRADLIIALTDGRLARRPDSPNKVVTDRQILGASVPNPYPDNDDAASLANYRQVRDMLDRLLLKRFERILKRAGARPTI